ncbi:thiol-disulfide oxidoreductase DCC family protein [Sphingomonas lenta]|uniref:Thiol-disulfide oxidoreductase DCC n=1 Tax=Sphingomonas lenta TaxID=1141887 RepID=A0A2A2SD31_9SPHN|nr:DCC1-like thiol-disulfide oxidoreductase family protein [Sphingomonas lenta]PAX07167.1 thiol-disulfide oxidoreductase DCC [Sphingomonas lenta]
MPEHGRPWSYRDDPAVPAFDDGRALFVFDGECVLCSGGASRLMRWDKRGRVNFTPTVSPLGAALYHHYGVDPDASYLLVADGRGYTASAGYLKLCAVLGGPWRLLRLGRLVPERWRDAAYARLARNRYRWFGRASHCALLTPEQRARLL